MTELPLLHDIDGQERHVGVELEFGGLSEDRAAHSIALALDGEARREDETRWIVETPELGQSEVYLDSKFRARSVGPITGFLLDAARSVVPVEWVTAPMPPSALRQVDQACAALRDAGATGTRDGLLLGFGLHLNVQIADRDGAHLARVLSAYAFIEEVLRTEIPIDPSRRLLPFVKRYPEALLDTLAARLPSNLDDLARTYLAATRSRNHGLDMLPVFAELCPEVLATVNAKSSAIKARPAWHFRLPDARIDTPGWDTRTAWEMWVLVENIAEDSRTLDQLRSAWRKRQSGSRLTRRSWFETAEVILHEQGYRPELAEHVA